MLPTASGMIETTTSTKSTHEPTGRRIVFQHTAAETTYAPPKSPRKSEVLQLRHASPLRWTTFLGARAQRMAASQSERNCIVTAETQKRRHIHWCEEDAGRPRMRFVHSASAIP